MLRVGMSTARPCFSSCAQLGAVPSYIPGWGCFAKQAACVEQDGQIAQGAMYRSWEWLCAPPRAAGWSSIEAGRGFVGHKQP